ncbi:MAG TPA: sugar ABC transporter ATP-binding protein [Candidatus Nanopelagicaceae bacterium]
MKSAPHRNLDSDTYEISLVGISKSFGGVAALSDIALKIRAGEIHSLVGENGAGKSTLGKIISGITTPDSGTLSLGGQEMSFGSPRDALAHGIVTIAQELAIVPALTVAENVLLGDEPRARGFIKRRELRRRFDELAKKVGFEFSSDTIAGTLSIADQQKVEILRALSRNASVIIMDEPTAALSRIESHALHEVIRSLAAEGKTVILISHFLSEVLSLSDTITVLRDGQLIKTMAASEVTEDGLIELMLGRTLGALYPAKTHPKFNSPSVMFVNNLSAPGVSNAWLSLRAGEILGIAGLVGSGRSELARAIFQDSPAFSGSITVNGAVLAGKSPRVALQKQVVMIPESRKDSGLLLGRSIQENITLSSLEKMSKWGWILRSQESKITKQALELVKVKSAGAKQKVSALSGGNQQKVLFARMLLNSPRVLIADEPTRGVDVGSKRAIYDLLTDLAKDGLGIIVISSDLEEVLGLAHRVVVMRQGRIVTELTGRAMNEQAVLEAAFAEQI